jgi:hypothetical protein
VTELSEELEICAKIMATCGGEGGIPISVLMARVAEAAPEFRHRCFPQIAQLVKYGILEVVK